jgi:hypothetical protein
MGQPAITSELFAVPRESVFVAAQARGFTLIFGGALLCHLALVWAFPVPPWPDLPFHRATAYIRSAYNAPGSVLPNYYGLPALGAKPNIAYHLATATGILGQVERADRIVYSLYVLATPLLVLAILRRCGGNAWFALLAIPLMYNFSVTYGFVEFTFGIPLLLALFLSLLCESRAMPVVRGVILAALFYAHAMMAVAGLCLLSVHVLLWSWRRGIRNTFHLLSALPALALLAHWYLSQRGGGGAGWLAHYYKGRYLPEFGTRVADLFRLDNGVLISAAVAPWIAAGFTLSIAAAIVWTLLRPRTAVRTEDRGRLTGLWAWLITMGAIVLLAPPGFPPFWWIYERFIWALWLGLIVLAAVRTGPRMPAKAVAGFVVLLAVHAALWAEHLASFRNEHRDLRAVLVEHEPQYVLGMYMADTRYRGEREAFVHFGDHATLVGGGPVVSHIYDFPQVQVERRVSRDVFPMYQDIQTQGPSAYVDLAAIDDVLVRGGLTPGRDDEFGCAFVPVKTAGAWTLYRRAGSSNAVGR